MFATIYLPDFYLQAALRHHTALRGQPVALIDGEAPKPVILQLTKAAETAGVRTGMTPSQGLARCLSLLIRPRNRAQENQMQELLLATGFSLAPFVESTAPGICTVQFAQARDIPGKVGRAVNQLAACEILARAGIAPTADASFLAAHLAGDVLQIEQPRNFLAPLPIETLSILPV